MALPIPPESGAWILFVCQHARSGDRASCHREDGDLHGRLKQAVAAANLGIRVVKSGCLGPCEKGPNALLHPTGQWFHRLETDRIPDLVAQLSQLRSSASAET